MGQAEPDIMAPTLASNHNQEFPQANSSFTCSLPPCHC
jgi:hypothetical protein